MRKLFLRMLAMLSIGSVCHADPSKPTADMIVIEMALFYAAKPTGDPLAKLRDLCLQPATAFRVCETHKGPYEPLPAVVASWASLDMYAPPDEQAWPYRTRDLPKEVQPKIAASDRALVLDFLVSKRDIVQANERIAKLVAALAEATGGLPWDQESRQLFSVAAWRKSRVDSWYRGIPDMSEHVIMDAYRDGEFLRVVTLGMRKFAISDMVATGVIAHTSRSIGHTVNACAQALVEGTAIRDKKMTIDFAAIKHPTVRELLQANPGMGATGKTVVSLTPIKPEEGDADNSLLDLDFPTAGATKPERQQKAMAILFGATDSLTKAEADDAELKAASARARKRLIRLRDRFIKGFEPTEHLTVKGPFKAEDGRVEYMWVEVTEWSGNTLRGLLVNEPFWVKGIKPGSRVTVREEEVFDFIWLKSDGTKEGNETGVILERAAPP